MLASDVCELLGAYVLELGKQKSLTVTAGPIGQLAREQIELERLPPVPKVQLLARDTSVAEVALKIEHVHRDMKSLMHEIGLMKGDIAELREECIRNGRVAIFQEKELRLRSGSLDEVQRRVSDCKARLDVLDARRDGNYNAYNSFEAVSRELTELVELKRKFREVDRRLRLSAYFFCGSVLAWAIVLVVL
ncbi:MAG: hypothetical protein WC807_01365 [Hyphomicrobium sp.]